MTGKVVRLHRATTSGPIALSDESLVAACATGDPAALGALYDRHHEAVLRFVARLSGAGNDDVDDLVQDTFLAARAAAPRFRGGSAVRTWLLGIAANVVRHALRSRGRRRALVNALDSVAPDPIAQPDRGAEVGQLREATMRAIAELPHDLRAVFVLCDLEELSGAEVADALGVPEGTVFRRRHDARRALREKLGGLR